MSSIYACFICGLDIECRQYDGSWWQQFRILYPVLPDAASTVYADAGPTAPPDAKISGVGVSVDNSWRVPLDEHMRWDDDSYVPQESDRVAMMKGAGFVLHDACWDLLREALDPQPVPFEKLYRLCKLIPNNDGWLCWGHNYGGLLVLDHPHQLRKPLGSNLITWQALSDPSNVREARNLPAPQGKETGSRLVGPFRGGRDCFARIPFEIREEIAAVTLTSDAINLGLASRYFTDIMTSRFFWASRFAPGGERDYLFETRRSKQGTNWKTFYQGTDWKELYESTGEKHASPSLTHRIRIWKLIRYIVKRLKLLSEIAESRVAETGQLRDVEDPDLRWGQVVGNVGGELGSSVASSLN